MKFGRFLDWNLLSANYDFSIDMLRIYFHRVNWAMILRRIVFPEDFLREMASSFGEYWDIVSKHQKLSESFIHDFANKVDWENIMLYQNVSGRFLEEHKLYIDSDVPN